MDMSIFLENKSLPVKIKVMKNYINHNREELLKSGLLESFRSYIRDVYELSLKSHIEKLENNIRGYSSWELKGEYHISSGIEWMKSFESYPIYIYRLQFPCNAVYIGQTLRMPGRIGDMGQRYHAAYEEWSKHREVKVDILSQGHSSRYILEVERGYINRYGTLNRDISDPSRKFSCSPPSVKRQSLPER